MFDPLNIRYATDTTNMQLWNTHNPFRACLLCADGHMVMWEYKNSPFLVTFNPLVRELRSGATFFYNSTGDAGQMAARAFAAQVDEVMRAHAGSNRRLAGGQDHGARVAGTGIRRVSPWRKARKSPNAPAPSRGPTTSLRCAARNMPASNRDRRNGAHSPARPSRKGGRARTTSGRGCTPKTSGAAASGSRRGCWPPARAPTPGSRNAGQGSCRTTKIVAFDTDLIGAYGFCIDISRTWWIGDKRPTNAMISAFGHALDHIRDHESRLKPGVSIRELVFGGHQLDDRYWKQKYSCKMHGVGLCGRMALCHLPRWLDGRRDGCRA